jgi:hypothetical protein
LSSIVNKQLSINNTIDVPSVDNLYSFNVGGYAGGFIFGRVGWESSSSWIDLKVRNSSGYKDLASYYIPNGTLTIYDEAKEIIFTDGDDIGNPEFISWVERYFHAIEPFIYKVSKNALIKSADAIRQKSGTTTSKLFDPKTGFMYAIQAIYLGNDTRNSTAYASDIAEGVTAFSLEREMTGIIPLAKGVSF